MITCQYCHTQFDWSKLPQIKTGLVECPLCFELVDIQGNHFKFVVGDFVYIKFMPQNPGKVIAAYPASHSHDFPKYQIKWWKDRSITTHREHFLNDFWALIKDHQKKLKTHTSKLDDLALM